MRVFRWWKKHRREVEACSSKWDKPDDVRDLVASSRRLKLFVLSRTHLQAKSRSPSARCWWLFTAIIEETVCKDRRCTMLAQRLGLPHLRGAGSFVVATFIDFRGPDSFCLSLCCTSRERSVCRCQPSGSLSASLP